MTSYLLGVPSLLIVFFITCLFVIFTCLGFLILISTLLLAEISSLCCYDHFGFQPPFFEKSYLFLHSFLLRVLYYTPYSWETFFTFLSIFVYVPPCNFFQLLGTILSPSSPRYLFFLSLLIL